jgi:hypothetical protein
VTFRFEIIQLQPNVIANYTTRGSMVVGVGCQNQTSIPHLRLPSGNPRNLRLSCCPGQLPGRKYFLVDILIHVYCDPDVDMEDDRRKNGAESTARLNGQNKVTKGSYIGLGDIPPVNLLPVAKATQHHTTLERVTFSLSPSKQIILSRDTITRQAAPFLNFATGNLTKEYCKRAGG